MFQYQDNQEQGNQHLLIKISSNLDIETGEISKHLGRGRHTTRHTEFYRIDDFYIADTPGFSSLDLTFIEKKIFNIYLKNLLNMNVNLNLVII